MASSFAKECTELKHKYDNCFNDWYANKYFPSPALADARFLQGEGRTNECQGLFDQYRACVEVRLMIEAS